MFTLFHGTTLNAYRDIIEGKYDASKGSNPWNCSDFNKIYFYDPVAILNSEFDSDSECEQEAKDMAQKFANEASQIVTALSENPDDRTVVLEFIFQDDEIYFEDIEENSSCPNMPWAVQMDTDKFNKLMKEGKHSIRIHFYQFYPKMSLCYLVPLADSNLFNLKSLKYEERVLLLQLKNMECYTLYDALIYDLSEKEEEMMELHSVKFLDSSTNTSH